MFEWGNQIRFTLKEIEDAVDRGLDLSGVTTRAGYANEVIRLITALQHDRPELLEKIANALAEKHRLTLPPKLGVV